MSSKRTYRISNWAAYNRALIARGDITLWFDEAVIKSWHNNRSDGKVGRPTTYSNIAVETALSLRNIFRLPLRATEGLITSVIRQLKLPLKAPSYSTLCRRQRTLSVSLPRIAKGSALHVVVDATGLKIYGEGEWKVRQHGYSKRRTWRKLHLAIDESNGDILSAVFTGAESGDGEQLPDLLEMIEEQIDQVSGDGAYDSWHNHEVIQQYKARAAIPPREGSKIKQHGNSKKPPLARDEILRAIRKIGKSEWKKISGYHRRSLSETVVFRLKQIFGSNLRNRIFEHQATEAFIRCAVLNRFNQLGMPESYVLEA